MSAPRIVYTRLLFWADGFTPLPTLVLIHPSRKGDAALIAHEETHARQMRELGWRRWWLKYLTRSGRLALELEAYRVQLALAPNSLESLAGHLARDYRLNITLAQARELLQRPGPGTGAVA